MTSCKSGLGYRACPGLLAGAMLWTLSFARAVSAQSGRTIDAGTTITVRTNEQINASNSDGRVFSGVVEQDVINRRGNVAIPKGANVELLVKNIAKNQVALDLDSVTVNGQRYGIQSQDSVVSSQGADGLGANKRTGKYVGGGAAIGAIIGAIAGRRKRRGDWRRDWRGSGSRYSGPDPGQKRKCSGRVVGDVSFGTTAANGDRG